MEAMASSLRLPPCAARNCTRESNCRAALFWKSFTQSLGERASGFRPCPSRTRLQVECTARSLKQVKPLQASELQEKFGSNNLRFSDVGGRTVVELKMNQGTAVRLSLQDARITSYKCRLWHGSIEEFLYTDVLESRDEGSVHSATPQQVSIIGGMAPSLAHYLPPHCCLFDNWFVESVIVDPDKHIQVTLRCVVKNRGGWRFLLQNVITLTDEVLASALVLTNKGSKPLMFTGSVSTHLAIRATEAVSCAGLGGCQYYSPSEAALKVVQANSISNSFFGKLKRFVLQSQSNQKATADNIEGTNETQKQSPSNFGEDETHWFTEKPGEVVSPTNGVRKIYFNPPNRMRVTDEGFRRSLLFESHGFENLEVASPDSDGDNPFVSIGCSTVLSPLTLNSGETWKAAQVLCPDTK